MKTKNNVQKTALRTAAVIASFVLISITVSAQDFWKNLLINNSFNEIALAMTDSGQKHSGNEKSGTYGAGESIEKRSVSQIREVNEGNQHPVEIFQTETEMPMVLENWMTSDAWFHVTGKEMTP